MNIANYVSYFHDGSILNIQQEEKEILIYMESAELSPTDLKDSLILSEDNTLKGVLHLVHPVSIENSSNKTGKIKMLAEIAGILDFEISENKKIWLFVEWINYSKHKVIEEYSDINIEAERIFWKNMPFLYNAAERI